MPLTVFPLRFFAGSRLCFCTSLLVASALIGNANAADNSLTPEEVADGWELLFNGHDLNGWKNNDGKPVGAKIEDGTINVHGTGGYLLVYDRPIGDFVLRCDVKMSEPECNSGVFFRVGDLADPVNTGLEVQVFAGDETPLHEFGAIYDLVAPSHDATRGPGGWNTLEIRCVGPEISVNVNGEEVATLNCDELDQPGLRADGSQHKFAGKAIKDFPRSGYIGLQDHGHDVWYKNIQLKEL
jgi:3-keto-disaccharide hydrolase